MYKRMNDSLNKKERMDDLKMKEGSKERRNEATIEITNAF